MLVYVADLLLDYLVRGPWRDPAGFNFPTTAEFDPVATVPVLIEGGRLHFGCGDRTCGVAAATDAARENHQGFRNPRRRRRPPRRAVRRLQFQPVDSPDLRHIGRARRPCRHHRGRGAGRESAPPASLPGYGFTAIIVAFLGRLNPIGILIAGLFLALTFIGGEQAQIAMKIPLDVTKVFQGILLFYVLACDSLILYRFRLISAPRKVSRGAA